MGAVIKLANVSGKVELLDAYREVIADGYNTGRTFSHTTAQVMIGFLASAVLALRYTGDDLWAHHFQTAGEQLEADWRCYRDVVPRLCRQIDAR